MKSILAHQGGECGLWLVAHLLHHGEDTLPRRVGNARGIPNNVRNRLGGDTGLGRDVAVARYVRTIPGGSVQSFLPDGTIHL